MLLRFYWVPISDIDKLDVMDSRFPLMILFIENSIQSNI